MRKSIASISHTHIQELRKEHGHSISNFDISGDARVHLGDRYIANHYHAATKPQPDIYETLLDSLTFDRMNARIHNVLAALPMTCDWLPQHTDFLAWIDNSKFHEHHGFLWIKGKPGSGKSTVMKETFTWAKQAWPGQAILSYFYNARSPHLLEKSSLGLYRSLTCQLLALLPRDRALFTTEFASKLRNDRVEDW